MLVGRSGVVHSLRMISSNDWLVRDATATKSYHNFGLAPHKSRYHPHNWIYAELPVRYSEPKQKNRLQCLLYLVSLGRMARMAAEVLPKSHFTRYSMTI